VRLHAEADRQRALRVEVDQQHPPAVFGQRRAEVDRRGGLADPALLVAESDDAGGSVALQRLGFGDRPGPALGGRVGGTGRAWLLAVIAGVAGFLANAPGGRAHVVGGKQSAVLRATVYRHAHQSIGLSSA
jgi:hypothetical protein